MYLIKPSILQLFSLSALLPASVFVEAHGYLKSPRSRNWVAQEDGVNSRGPDFAGKPEQDFCPHCLNSKAANNLCSKGNAATLYDNWLDINGNPMPWDSQGIYDEGGLMEVEAVLTTNHAGHMDMYICPDGDDSTQECLWDNPLTMVRDEFYGGPTDSSYPERAYFANDQSQFKYTYKLPEGVCGEKILVQWRYITANSCFPPGYKNTAVGQRLQELGWLRASGMSDCQYPYDPTGATGAGKPEQFWNCAEITIKCANPTVSPAPTPPPQPTPQPKPTASPTKAPVAAPGFGYCNYGGTHDTSREKCDGLFEGGEWCNQNQAQCEGPCNGNWCTTGAPTPPTPVTASPTAYPTYVVTTSPTKIPTTQPTGCTEDPADEFFLRYKQGDPTRPAIKTCEWLAASDPVKINRLCTKFTASHDIYGPPGEVCKVTCGNCPTSSPTQSSTSSPTKSPVTPVTGAPTETPTGAPTPTPVGGTATTTRYWDCSGGSCGCGYIPPGASDPAHCSSNALFSAPSGNQYGAKFYGTAAISASLGGGDWLTGCGQCFKVSGTGNVGGMFGKETTLVLKSANYCPAGNPFCEAGPHFDIAAPGFDFRSASLSNNCEKLFGDDAAPYFACENWPNSSCNCDVFTDPTLREGCQNFLSLGWNNVQVTYEKVDCPVELERQNCWLENGGGWPTTEPQWCANN